MVRPVIDRYWLVARDKPGLLVAMMRQLAGSAHVSFEGDLTRCEFPRDLSPSPHETPALRRQTTVPRLDFVVLPLEAYTIRSILDVVLPDRRFMRDIDHIQIEKDGVLQFGSYDNFHHECIVAFLSVPTAFLDDLQGKGVLRSWTVPFEGARRWHG